MAMMTEEEAVALDEAWTQNPPDIDVGKGGGFFARHGADVLVLDHTTAGIINAASMAAHKLPSEWVAEMVRREIAYA
jgi:hypothetical protein